MKEKKHSWLIDVLRIVLFGALILLADLSFAQGKVTGKPDKKPPPPNPLVLDDVNIVTTEADRDGRLRVWGNDSDTSYTEIWAVECVHHGSVAIGDIDSDEDGISEVIVPGSCQVTEGKGKSRNTFYKIFINIYKEGISGVWKSTFESESDYVREKKNFWFNETMIANVDDEPDNEIVLLTETNVAVFKYDTENEKLSLVTSIAFDEDDLSLQSVTVANIDTDPQKEIIVSANPLSPSGEIKENQGSLLFFLDGSNLSVDLKLLIDANLGHQSLRTGDLDGDGDVELCSTGYTTDGSTYQVNLYVWDNQTGWILDVEPLFASSDWPWCHLAVGEIYGTQDEEIVICTSTSPAQLMRYNWDSGSKFSEPYTLVLLPDYAIINWINIANSDSDSLNEIIVGGGWKSSERNVGSFYLEVFDGTGVSKWKRSGGSRDEHSVWYAAVGKKVGE